MSMRALRYEELLPVGRDAARALERLWCDERGSTTVEYALLLSLVAVASMAAWASVSATLGKSFERIATVVSGDAPEP